MGVFHVFKIVQMVPNRVEHYVIFSIYQLNDVFNGGLPPEASKFELKNILKSLAKITFFY